MKAYHGTRDSRGRCSVWVEDEGTRPLPLRDDLWYYPGSGAVSWGYWSYGARRLALAILADATGSDALAVVLHPDFAADVVRDLPRASFLLTEAAVRAYIGCCDKCKLDADLHTYSGLWLSPDLLVF